MSSFGGRNPEEVRQDLFVNGVLCGHRDGNGDNDCPVIIQRAKDGTLNDGVNSHWSVVHGKGK